MHVDVHQEYRHIYTCMYMYTYMYMYTRCILENTSIQIDVHSVSPRMNIMGGGWISGTWHLVNNAHKTVFFSINFKIKGRGSKAKRWGSTMLSPFRRNTECTCSILKNTIHVLIFKCSIVLYYTCNTQYI